ncbi:MAG: aspartyl protease [Stigonema ocellatum SAG 48.90 = DSM 106950]|nr:aspartyl protease [Stigonema ocellatum SAG 48.90 = DSM 106950]
MKLSKSQTMGKVTTTITITNQIDLTLAERGFIPTEQIRSITLDDVLVDTGATRLCLPKNLILDLGLPFQGEVDVKMATGLYKARVLKMLNLSVEGREGIFNCIELPEGSEPLLGLIPLEDLGLEPDLQNQKLRVLPMEGKDTYLMVL